jgi:2-succinyl-5-enolpyruvyl-6-hydroxy-3-cyclohexene-1-carboxylate synthase
VVIAQGPGRWADPQRAATDVAPAIRLTAVPDPAEDSRAGWRTGAGRTARPGARRTPCSMTAMPDRAAAGPGYRQPRASGRTALDRVSLPVRDIDFHLSPRDDLRILASRGASGIDGTTSAAIGAALAHGGPAFAVIGDLTFLHDAPGLALGPSEPRPDLCLIVINNDGGGIFSTLEQAAFPGSFERVFGTPHGAELKHLAAAFGLPYQRLEQPGDLSKVLQGTGLRIVEAQTDRAAGAALRARRGRCAAQAVRSVL